MGVCNAIISYYESKMDPFATKKLIELQSKETWKLVSEAMQVIDTLIEGELLEHMLKLCLWGNKADACFKSEDDMASGVGKAIHEHDELILTNHCIQVVKHLKSTGPDSTVSFINDNSGAELLMDLCLADVLLRKRWCSKVVFNLKEHPTYVSDATVMDAKITLDCMSNQVDKGLTELAGRLQQYLDLGKLQWQSHRFWNSCKFFWDMPSDVIHNLKSSGLTIIKGDANYRRLLGDRLWEASTPIQEAVPYFPSPFVSLRTLKSNPIVNVDKTIHEKLNLQDPTWRFNGKRGIIQAVL